MTSRRCAPRPRPVGGSRPFRVFRAGRSTRLVLSRLVSRRATHVGTTTADGEAMSAALPRARNLAVVSFAAAIFLLGHVAAGLSPQGLDVAPWWPAAGIAVAAVVRYRRDRWWYLSALAVASMLANLTGGRPWAVAIGFAVGNTAEAWVAAAVITGRRDALLDRLGDVGWFVAGVTLGAVTIGTTTALTLHA